MQELKLNQKEWKPVRIDQIRTALLQHLPFATVTNFIAGICKCNPKRCYILDQFICEVYQTFKDGSNIIPVVVKRHKPTPEEVLWLTLHLTRKGYRDSPPDLESQKEITLVRADKGSLQARVACYGCHRQLDVDFGVKGLKKWVLQHTDPQGYQNRGLSLGYFCGVTFACGPKLKRLLELIYYLLKYKWCIPPNVYTKFHGIAVGFPEAGDAWSDDPWIHYRALFHLSFLLREPALPLNIKSLPPRESTKTTRPKHK